MSSRIMFKLSKGTPGISSDQICVYFMYFAVRASRADEKERKKKKMKSNISRCVYAFRQVMMFSKSI